MDIKEELKKAKDEMELLTKALVDKKNQYQEEMQKKSQALQAESDVKNKELQGMANQVVEAQGAVKKLEELVKE